MILISHRGNINGPNPEMENKPEYIKKANKLGYNVEIDIWRFGKKLYLGHDKPQYYVVPKFLYSGQYWIHAKNIEALNWLMVFGRSLNYFWHEEDKFTVTSKGFIWAYPSDTVYDKAVNVLPERNLLGKDRFKYTDSICSDYVERYK